MALKEKINNKKDAYKRTLKNVYFILELIYRSEKKYFAIKLASVILSGFYPLINVFFSKFIMDSIINKQQFDYVLKVIAYFVLGQIFYLLIQSALSYFNTINSLRVVQYINNKLVLKMTDLDISYFENTKFYNDLHKAQSEAGNRAKSTLDKVFSIFSSIITVTTLSYVLLYLEPLIILFILFVIILTFIISNRIKRLVHNHVEKTSPINRKTGYFYYILTSIVFSKELRIHNIGDWIISKYNQSIEASIKMNRLFNKRRIKMDNTNSIISKLQDGVLYVVLSYKAIKGSITIGEFTMHLAAIQSFTQNLIVITSQLSGLYEDSLFIENLRHFLNIETKIKSGSKQALIEKNSDDPLIEFQNVSFKYPEQQKYTIKNFNFTIFPGEKVLVVGKNGAGKSTFIKLLTRLYDPLEGRILLNGNDIIQFNLTSYRNLFGVSFQDHCKFALSIKENILLSDENEVSKVISSLRKSGLEAKISQLEHGIDTQLTKEFDSKGTDLSSGEMQKISLSRCFSRDCNIFILDEPTSFLDPNAEKQINAELLCDDRTTIIVSHRLSFAKTVDKIIVMNFGEIVQIGTHDELIAIQGLYKEMYESQANSYIDQYIAV